MTIVDVYRAAEDAQEHKRLVNEWALSTWDAWRMHHPKVRQWASEIISNL